MTLRNGRASCAMGMIMMLVMRVLMTMGMSVVVMILGMIHALSLKDRVTPA
jgi:hypothetical protein